MGSKSPICGTTDRSTMDLATCRGARRRAASPSARATASDVPTQSLSKSTSVISCTSGAVCSAIATVATHGVAADTRRSARAARCRCPSSPTTSLRIGRDADGAGDVRRIAVAGLHQPVIEARREEHHRLRPRGLDDQPGVGGDAGPPREHAEVAASRDARTPAYGPRISITVSRGATRSPSRAPGPRGRSSESVGQAGAQDRDRLVYAAETGRPASETPASSPAGCGRWPPARRGCARSTCPSNSPRACRRPAAGSVPAERGPGTQRRRWRCWRA